MLEATETWGCLLLQPKQLLLTDARWNPEASTASLSRTQGEIGDEDNTLDKGINDCDQREKTVTPAVSIRLCMEPCMLKTLKQGKYY